MWRCDCDPMLIGFSDFVLLLLRFMFCFVRLDDLVVEKERVKSLTEEIEQTVSEIQGS